MTHYPYNIGPQSITIYGPQGPVSGARNDATIEAIKAGDWQAAIASLTPIARIKQAALSYGDCSVVGQSVLFKGRQINNGSSQRILDLIDAGLPIDSELRCLASLMRHDDSRVIESFESFLDRWQVPRVSDGRIVLCKGVAADFKDLHSGTVDWSVGGTVSMPWDSVDRDPSNTCSTGLHAAPYQGAKSYLQGASRLIELYIWPEHIAALPIDYTHNGKVRVVQAYVAREVPRDIAAKYYDLAPLVIEQDSDDSDSYDTRGESFYNESRSMYED
jgi:hypothetical protein